jgi:hypothetical protein
MKRIKIAFDCIVTDKTAQELMDAPEICVQDNIMDALEINDTCECALDLRIEEIWE